MGKGKKSMTASTGLPPMDARGDRQFFGQLRDALMREADASRDGKSVLSKNDVIVSEAGAALVGTERGFSLVNDKDFKSLRRVQDDIYGKSTIHALGDLQKTLSPDLNERPLWATADEWADAKRSVKADFAKLEAKGYTRGEVMAALAYGRYLVREGSKNLPVRSKIPSGMSKESYDRYVSQGFSQSEIEKIWRDTLKRRKEMKSGRSRARTEAEVVSTTYEQAQRRRQKDFDNWFRR